MLKKKKKTKKVHKNMKKFFAYLEKEDLSKMEKQLGEKNVSINFTNENSQGAIHLACETGKIHLVKWVVQHGGDVNLCDEKLNTPLHISCKKEKLNIVKFLVSKNAKIDAKNDFDQTPAQVSSKTTIKDFLKDTLYVQKQISGISLAELTAMSTAQDKLKKSNEEITNLKAEIETLKDEKEKLAKKCKEFENENTGILNTLKKGKTELKNLEAEKSELQYLKKYVPTWQNLREYVDKLIGTMKIDKNDVAIVKDTNVQVMKLNDKILKAGDNIDSNDASSIKGEVEKLEEKCEKVSKDLRRIKILFEDQNLLKLADFFKSFEVFKKEVEESLKIVELIKIENEEKMRNSKTVVALIKEYSELHKKYLEKSKEKRKFKLKLEFGIEDDVLSAAKIEEGKKKLKGMEDVEMSLKRQFEEKDRLIGNIKDCYEIYRIEGKKYIKEVSGIKIDDDDAIKFLFNNNLFVKRSLQDYSNLQLLKKQASEDLYSAVLKNSINNKKVCLKVRNFDSSSPGDLEELKILFDLNHEKMLFPNCVFFFTSKDSHQNQVAIEYDYHERNILEWAKDRNEKDNNVLLKKKTKRSQKELKFIFKQLFEAVIYIHSKDRIHNSIRPDNIRITNDDEVKLSDFAISEPIDSLKVSKTKTLSMKNIKNEESRYSAPEKSMSKAGDIYSLGVLILEIICNLSKDAKCFRNTEETPIIDNLPASLDEVETKFLQSLLNPDADKRISAEKALEDKFFTDYKKEKVDRSSIRMNSSSHKPVIIALERETDDCVDKVLNFFNDVKDANQLLTEVYVTYKENGKEVKKRLEDHITIFCQQFVKSKYVEKVPRFDYYLPSSINEYEIEFQSLGKLMMRCLVSTVMMQQLSFHAFYYIFLLSSDSSLETLISICNTYDPFFTKKICAVQSITDLKSLSLSYLGNKVTQKNKLDYLKYKLKAKLLGDGAFRFKNLMACKRGFFGCIASNRTIEVKKFKYTDLMFFVQGSSK